MHTMCLYTTGFIAHPKKKKRRHGGLFHYMRYIGSGEQLCMMPSTARVKPLKHRGIVRTLATPRYSNDQKTKAGHWQIFKIIMDILSEKSPKGYQLVIKHRRSWLEINEAGSIWSVGYQLKYVTLFSSQLRQCLITFDILLEIFPTLRLQVNSQ